MMVLQGNFKSPQNYLYYIIITPLLHYEYSVVIGTCLLECQVVITTLLLSYFLHYSMFQWLLLFASAVQC